MVAILHEGGSDKRNIINILNYLDITYTDNNFYKMTNKSSFYDPEHKVYKTLKQNIENGKISKVLFILDADYEDDQKTTGGKAKTISSLESIISQLSLTCEYEIFVVCEPSLDEGYFETLLLSSVDTKIKECYEEFNICTGLNKEEDVKKTMGKLYQLTSPKKPYSYEHENFTPLKDTLTKLFS